MDTICIIGRATIQDVSVTALDTLRIVPRMEWWTTARKRMAELGLNQDDLADALDMTRGNIGHYLKGRRDPGVGGITKIAKRLGMSVSDLIGDVDQAGRIALPPLPAQVSGEIAIPRMNVAGSMGLGVPPPDHIEAVQYITARVNELRKQCSFSAPENLQIITGYGRSMLPTFGPGDPLLVDTGITTVELDAVYVFSFGGDLFIKGLQRIPGNGLKVISHNREENDPWTIERADMGSMRIHGRVVLAWNSRRL